MTSEVTRRQSQYSPYSQPVNTVVRHPIGFGLGAALLITAAVVGVSYLPDLVRYMKIKNM
jgi:hypothetical protein